MSKSPQRIVDIVTCVERTMRLELELFSSNSSPVRLFQMIRFFLLQNRQGKTRLSKWYSTPPDDAERAKMENDINRVVSSRSKGHTNFVEYQNFKLIYRRYAGLYFIFGADVTDNELLLMETIHLFVELLDQYFSNVCELDIVFHFNKVYGVLDEFILAGEIQETSKRVILDRMRDLERLE